MDTLRIDTFEGYPWRHLGSSYVVFALLSWLRFACYICHGSQTNRTSACCPEERTGGTTIMLSRPSNLVVQQGERQAGDRACISYLNNRKLNDKYFGL